MRKFSAIKRSGKYQVATNCSFSNSNTTNKNNNILKTRLSNSSWKKILHFIRFNLNTLLILATLAVIAQILKQPSELVDASLIRIYHKYRPKTSLDSSDQRQYPSKKSESLLNSTLLDADSISSSIEQGIAATDEAGLASFEPSIGQDDGQTTAIEFSSPMKRIMELIGGHPPVIVLSSNDENSNTQSSPSNSFNTQQTGLSTTSSDQRQHWTILDPSGQMVATTSPSGAASLSQQQPAGFLATQQQQLYQSSVPLEQAYYIATSQPSSSSTGNQQFTVIPTFNSATTSGSSYQQFPTSAGYQIPFHLAPTTSASLLENQQQQRQQSQVVQQTSQQLINQAIDHDKAQPIFLSSYVPEVPLTNNLKTSVSVGNNELPNSIQQVQYSQVEPTKKLAADSSKSKSIDSDTSDESPSEGYSLNSDKNSSDSDGASDEEPSEENNKTKRSHNDGKNEEEDTDDGPATGSMSYENKFDSDRDEQPKESISTSNGFKEDRRAILNGLASTGLDDVCLQCICRASSGCDSSLRCITRGADEKYCGPFQLTEEYWNLAGSPGDEANSFIGFEECSNNEDCATETVVNYMKKYLRDCDDDKQITCMDYARLHRLKQSECEDTEKLNRKHEDYWTKFQHCAENYNRTKDGDDEHI